MKFLPPPTIATLQFKDVLSSGTMVVGACVVGSSVVTGAVVVGGSGVGAAVV